MSKPKVAYFSAEPQSYWKPSVGVYSHEPPSYFPKFLGEEVNLTTSHKKFSHDIFIFIVRKISPN